ncbi:MAG: methyltransferase domain-containing protein [Thermoplasmata archaeon]|nr:methyltransferase domain-containing protein [Thermoplasmata archaeon]
MDYDPEIRILSDPDVYPPSDDSILFIQSLNVRKGEKVLEIGCGSGVVSIHCAKNGCIVTSGDINPKAVKLTKRNAGENGVHITVVETDVYSNIEGRFDTILFNLPYLPVDEDGLLARSWSGGPDGLGPFPDLLDGSSDHLNPEGRIVVVISSLMDTQALWDLLDDYDVESIGELKLFFEKLAVLEIRPKAQ